MMGIVFASPGRPSPPGPEEETDRPSTGKSARRVLIVEDEAVVAMEIAAVLQEAGYLVVATAATGPAALAAAHRHDPDIVLMDITLHGSDDGIATAQRLRDECDVPSIFVSAASDPPTVARARIVGVGFVRKPYDPQQLLRTLAAAFGG